MVSLLQAVVIDLGDTLVHLTRPWDDVFNTNLESLHSYLTKMGLKLDFNRFAETFMRIFDDASSKADVYKIEVPMEDIITKALRKSRLEILGVDLIRNATMEFYRKEVEAWQLYPDARETLMALKDEGLRLGLISNAKSDWAVHAILERNEINGFFDDIVTSALLRIRKPRSEIFARVLSDLNVKASDAVFVGDNLDADVGGAKKIGMHSIHVIRKPVESVHSVIPEASVTSLNEAVAQIKEWKNDS